MTEQPYTPAPAEPVIPTQVAHPWRATWRTVIQVGVPAFLVLLGALPAALNILAEDLGRVLPPAVTAWLLAAATVITAVAGALARIAAIPGVNAWLAQIRLDAAGGN